MVHELYISKVSQINMSDINIHTASLKPDKTYPDYMISNGDKYGNLFRLFKRVARLAIGNINEWYCKSECLFLILNQFK